jgi:hypothetical protein
VADQCPYHADHETRISRLEATMEKIMEKIGSPAVTVAIIGVLGTMFSGCCAFLGVVMAPVVKSWLGL